MQIRRTLVLGGVAAAIVLAFAAAALAAGTKVSVRVEGVKRTLLSTTSVQTHAGSITKGGEPAGKCPSTSAAGALNAATHGNWGGSYNSQYKELVLNTIKGESWPLSQLKYYWGIWVNDVYQQVGMCEIKLRRGDQILFAADSDKKHEHPLGLTGAPKRAKVGKAFNIKVVSYSDSGKAKPLAGAQITGATPKHSIVLTSKQGIAKITPRRAGKLKLQATEKGYIRSALTSVSVSS